MSELSYHVSYAANAKDGAGLIFGSWVMTLPHRIRAADLPALTKELERAGHVTNAVILSFALLDAGDEGGVAHGA